MIHLQYFAVGVLALMALAIVPALVGASILMACRACVSETKHLPVTVKGCWGTGAFALTIMSVVYFVGAIFCILCKAS